MTTKRYYPVEGGELKYIMVAPHDKAEAKIQEILQRNSVVQEKCERGIVMFPGIVQKTTGCLSEEDKPGCFGAWGFATCRVWHQSGCPWSMRCKQSREDY
jgi:hypothetical protein